jgi:hypothetical protein
MSMPSLVIGSNTLQLRLPRSAVARLELADAARAADGNVRVRLGAAAIGLCWPPGRDQLRARYGGDIAAFGGQVGDELIERGVMREQIVEVGCACIDHLFDSGLPGVVDPKAEADPTFAQEGSAP